MQMTTNDACWNQHAQIIVYEISCSQLVTENLSRPLFSDFGTNTFIWKIFRAKVIRRQPRFTMSSYYERFDTDFSPTFIAKTQLLQIAPQIPI